MDYPSDCDGCLSISLMSANYYHILYQSMVTRWYFTLQTRYLKVKKNYLVCRLSCWKNYEFKKLYSFMYVFFFLETGRFLLSVIFILEWLHTGQNISPAQKIKLFIYWTNICLHNMILTFLRIHWLTVCTLFLCSPGR